MKLIGKMVEIYRGRSFAVFNVPFNMEVVFSPETIQIVKLTMILIAKTKCNFFLLGQRPLQ